MRGRLKGMGKVVIKRCKLCGKLFQAEGNAQYCSRCCAQEARRMQNKESKRNQRIGISRKGKCREMSELARINEEARELHMSYGQYVGKFDL